MDASARIYKRLGEIPEDPNDPESLDDLIVCAFGAFERYYLCWKTKGGAYKQDDYGLPSALKDWLYPSDGTTRDFASLQVVFGRGEEYFASDKHGKLEYKEPDVKKAAAADDEEKVEKQALRRSRTVSFLRPLSETSVRSDSVVSETSRSKRSSSISSQRASRPPSLSYTTSRTNSDASLLNDTIVEGQARAAPRPSQWSSLGWKATASAAPASEPAEPSPRQEQAFTRLDTTVEKTLSSLQAARAPTCTCTCHAPRPHTYTTASTQTSPPPSPPPRTTLRINTSTPPYQPSYAYYDTTAADDDYYYEAPPVVMGRMSSYFSKPGYQLGDSLFGGYAQGGWGGEGGGGMYVYQDEFGDEALR